MGDQLVIQDECETVLDKYLGDKNHKVVSFEILPFHNPLQGLVGDHFTLQINYIHNNATNKQDFFLKTINTNPLILEFSKTAQVYEKEEFFFTKLLPEFEQYKVDVSFAPRGYFFKPYVIILEDLSKFGFKGTPKRQLLDLDHCKICMEIIAKFHGAGIIFEQRKSGEFSLQKKYGDLLQDKITEGPEDSIAKNWMQRSIEGLFQLIDLIPENHITHEEFKGKLLEILEMKSVGEGTISGIIHADLWTTNFLYRYKDNKPIDGKLLDYQMIKYGPLESDLVEFLMTCTTRRFRDNYFNFLIGFYYENLHNLLLKAGFANMLVSKEEFVRSCHNFKLAGKLHAILDHSFTFVSDELYENALKTEESARKFFLQERGKYIIQSYNNNEEYRTVLLQDVLELRDLLFA